ETDPPLSLGVRKLRSEPRIGELAFGPRFVELLNALRGEAARGLIQKLDVVSPQGCELPRFPESPHPEIPGNFRCRRCLQRTFDKGGEDSARLWEQRLTGGEEDKIQLLQAPKQRQVILEMRDERNQIFRFRRNVGESNGGRAGDRRKEHREIIHKV